MNFGIFFDQKIRIFIAKEKEAVHRKFIEFRYLGSIIHTDREIEECLLYN